MKAHEVKGREYDLAEKLLFSASRLLSRMTADDDGEYSMSAAFSVFVVGPVIKLLSTGTPDEHRAKSAALLRAAATYCEVTTSTSTFEERKDAFRHVSDAANAWNAAVPCFKFESEDAEQDQPPTAASPAAEAQAVDDPSPVERVHEVTAAELLQAERVLDAAIASLPYPQAVTVAMFLSAISKRFYRELPEDQKELAASMLEAHAAFARAPFAEFPDDTFSERSQAIMSASNAFVKTRPVFAERSKLAMQ